MRIGVHLECASLEAGSDPDRSHLHSTLGIDLNVELCIRDKHMITCSWAFRVKGNGSYVCGILVVLSACERGAQK